MMRSLRAISGLAADAVTETVDAMLQLPALARQINGYQASLDALFAKGAGAFDEYTQAKAKMESVYAQYARIGRIIGAAIARGWNQQPERKAFWEPLWNRAFECNFIGDGSMGAWTLKEFVVTAAEAAAIAVFVLVGIPVGGIVGALSAVAALIVVLTRLVREANTVQVAPDGTPIPTVAQSVVSVGSLAVAGLVAWLIFGRKRR